MLSAWLGLQSEGLDRRGLIAGSLLASVGVAKLIDLIRTMRLSKHPRLKPHYFRATLRRSAIITVAATIWFVVVPVPAQFSFQFLDYSLTFSVAQLSQSLLVSVEVLGVVFGPGSLPARSRGGHCGFIISNLIATTMLGCSRERRRRPSGRW